MIDEYDELTGKTYDSQVAKRLLGYVVPYRGLVGLTVVAILAGAAVQLLIPWLFGLAIDVVSGNTERSFFGLTGKSAINGLALAFIGALVVQFIAGNRQQFLTAILGQKLVYDLREQMFGHLQRLSIRYIDQRGVGRIMSRVQNDAAVIEELFSEGIVTILSQLVILAGIVVVMLLTNVKLALMTFVVLPPMVVFTIWWRRKASKIYRETRAAIGRVNGDFAENIAGVRVVQAFAREPRNNQQFQVANNENLRVVTRGIVLDSVIYPVALALQMLATALIIYIGGQLILDGAFTIGELFTFIALLVLFYDPIWELSMSVNTMQAAMAAGERMFGLLDVEEEVTDRPGAVDLPRIVGHVEFDDVRFGYTDVDVVKGVSLDVQPGETIAFVGETGAGKSSMINLLARFYDIRSGAIRIDGYDIRDVTQRSLRSQMGIVLQDTFLFSGTIRSNICYGKPDATEEEIVRVAQAVGAHDFIMKLPGGYESEVYERGATLSSGQRQLISFARTLLTDPRIIILDEATANIDTETEQVIQRALRTLLEGRTSFIIAHRLSTIRDASRVVVLDHGRIVEIGNHDELMGRRGFYYHLHFMQFQSFMEEAAD
jgi:ABC-type multidrug transport system fused ATPase/permease subunit